MMKQRQIKKKRHNSAQCFTNFVVFQFESRQPRFWFVPDDSRLPIVDSMRDRRRSQDVIRMPRQTAAPVQLLPHALGSVDIGQKIVFHSHNDVFQWPFKQIRPESEAESRRLVGGGNNRKHRGSVPSARTIFKFYFPSHPVGCFFSSSCDASLFDCVVPMEGEL